MENVTNTLEPSNMTTSRPQDTDDDAYAAFYYNLADKLFVAVDPFITFGGIIGNILMFCVMIRKDQRRMGVSMFIIALAMTDNVVLILDFVNNWLKYAVKVYLMGMDEGFCVFHRFFFNVAYTFSAWLVVGVSVERFLAVVFPFKAKVICTVKNAIVTIVLMFLVIFFYYIYHIWSWHIDEEGFCNVKEDWTHFQNMIVPWLSGVVYSYIPIIALIFLNTMILVKLARSRKHLGKVTSGLDKAVNRHVTISVVTLCVTFLVLTVPLAVFYIVQIAAGQFIYQGPEMALIETLVLIFGLSNHAVNCLLYIIASNKFRSELLKMLGCGKYVKTSESSTGGVISNSKEIMKSKDLVTRGTASSNLSTAGHSISASNISVQMNDGD